MIIDKHPFQFPSVLLSPTKLIFRGSSLEFSKVASGLHQSAQRYLRSGSLLFGRFGVKRTNEQMFDLFLCRMIQLHSSVLVEPSTKLALDYFVVRCRRDSKLDFVHRLSDSILPDLPFAPSAPPWAEDKGKFGSFVN